MAVNPQLAKGLAESRVAAQDSYQAISKADPMSEPRSPGQKIPLLAERLPEAAKSTEPGGPGGSLKSDRLHFSQINKLSKAALVQNQTPPLLSTFEIERNGNQIRLFDADGSIYTGLLISEKRTVDALVNRDLKLTEKNELQARVESVPLSSVGAAPQETSFQAAGTNRTLNQPVLINATLFFATTAASNSQAGAASMPAAPSFRSPGAPLNAATAVPPVLFRADATREEASSANPSRGFAGPSPRLSNQPLVLRIQGHVKVGPAQELEIDAIPAPR
jgi:hypothetical protein